MKTYKIRTKFGRFRDVRMKKRGASHQCSDGKIWQIDDDLSVFLVGSTMKWDNGEWVERNKKGRAEPGMEYFIGSHRVYMGKLVEHEVVQ